MAPRIRRSPEEARKTILEAAEYQLRTKGPKAFRLADVASRAGMHQSNLLHHFGSRDALLRMVASSTFERAVRHARHAFGEARFASREDRVEALARVFDTIQQEGTGLYAWAILSGRLEETNAPDLNPLIRAMRDWRRAMFGDALDGQTEEELRQLLMLTAIVWLGEPVAGRVFGQVLELGDGDEAAKRFRRLLAGIMVAWLETEEERLRAQTPPVEQAAS